jgi:hypothetical protein
MDFKKILPHLLPHLIAIVASFIVMLYFFKPAVLDNKMLPQGDVQQATGMQTEVQAYRQKEATPTWTNQAYIGMPTYLVYNPQVSNGVQNVAYGIIFFGGVFNIADTHIIYFWLSVFGYIGLLLFGFRPLVAAVAAIFFTMMTNNLALLEAGHCNKVLAMGLALPVLGSAWRLLRGEILLGGATFAAFMSLQLAASHVQMVYYTFFVLAAMAISAFFYALSKKTLLLWGKSVGVMAAGVILGVLSNLTSLWTTYEYSAESTRGKSELTQKATTNGMDKNDIFAWAHTKMETFTLIMPNFMGGSSSTIWAVEKGSATAKEFAKLSKEGIPPDFLENLARSTGKYWGAQVFTAGPIYYGVVLVFLAILGLFFMRTPLRWGLLGVMVFFMMLSWGRDFSGFNNFMVDYFPFYNKFRDVKMTLAIGQSVSVILAAYALQSLIGLAPKEGAIRDTAAFDKAQKNIIYTSAIMLGLCFIAYIYPYVGDLTTNNPNYLLQLEDIRQKSPQVADVMEGVERAMQIDRAGLMQADALKALLFVLLIGGVAFAAIKNKMNIYVAVAVIIGAAVVDYAMVNSNYISEESFVARKGKNNVVAPPMSKADQTILADKDPHFRVLDFSRGHPASSAKAAYFHKIVGGHHAAKPMLFDEFAKVYDFPTGMIQNHPHLLEMLNTKYVIQNPDVAVPFATAMGNAWFVMDIKSVENADAELAAIADFIPRQTAIVQKRYDTYIQNMPPPTGANDKIYLTAYHPERLTYKSIADTERFAVFSEMYYPPKKGWNTYIDGKKIDEAFIKVDFLLRGLRVPAGEHTIEMRFEPRSVSLGELSALIASLLILGGLAYAAYSAYKKSKNTTAAAAH